MRFFIPAFLLMNTAVTASCPFEALIFTKTVGFQHSSIPDGIAMISDLSLSHGFTVTQTDNADYFHPDSLMKFDVVIWLSTTGDVLDSAQQTAFRNYIETGGSFIGIHAAADCEYNWPWYEELVGRWFSNHPAIQPAILDVHDGHTHPSSQPLPSSWSRTDEWYNFQTPFPDSLEVVLTVDESTYNGGDMGAFHPISWYHENLGGRSFYTAMGHTSNSYTNDTLFKAHILGALLWAAHCSVTNVSLESSQPDKILYPNPVSENLHIKGFPIGIPISIYNLNGTLVKSDLTKATTEISFDDLPAGIYLVKIQERLHSIVNYSTR
ncbi:MAG: ThuA domain-containing protein [Flavobacteriales bacterium]|nr:ThuA domain-containing protein [Flavobacteriales bacterium]